MADDNTASLWTPLTAAPTATKKKPDATATAAAAPDDTSAWTPLVQPQGQTGSEPEGFVHSFASQLGIPQAAEKIKELGYRYKGGDLTDRNSWETSPTPIRTAAKQMVESAPPVQAAVMLRDVLGQAWRKGKEAYGQVGQAGGSLAQGDWRGAASHYGQALTSAAEGIPFVGPIGEKVGQQVQQDDIPGAVGTALGGMAALKSPELIQRATGPVKPTTIEHPANALLRALPVPDTDADFVQNAHPTAASIKADYGMDANGNYRDNITDTPSLFNGAQQKIDKNSALLDQYKQILRRPGVNFYGDDLIKATDDAFPEADKRGAAYNPKTGRMEGGNPAYTSTMNEALRKWHGRTFNIDDFHKELSYISAEIGKAHAVSGATSQAINATMAGEPISVLKQQRTAGNGMIGQALDAVAPGTGDGYRQIQRQTSNLISLRDYALLATNKSLREQALTDLEALGRMANPMNLLRAKVGITPGESGGRMSPSEAVHGQTNDLIRRAFRDISPDDAELLAPAPSVPPPPPAPRGYPMGTTPPPGTAVVPMAGRAAGTHTYHLNLNPQLPPGNAPTNLPTIISPE